MRTIESAGDVCAAAARKSKQIRTIESARDMCAAAARKIVIWRGQDDEQQQAQSPSA